MARRLRIIVLRGDIYSDTGYGRATRALGTLLETQTDRMFAISLHEHAGRRHNNVRFPLIADVELMENPAFDGALVVNVCLPDSFVRVRRAVNIGYFFWETACLPPDRFWKASMMLMDRLWAPSHWQSDYLRTLTGREIIPVIPWPMEDSAPPPPSCAASLAAVRAHAPMTSAQLDNYLLRCSPADTRLPEKDFEEAEHRAGRSRRFDPEASPRFGDLLDRPGPLFVAVQTDAPRKGLPLLIASWTQFKASAEGRDARLIIKISSLDVHADLFRLHFHASLAVRRACGRSGLDRPDIWFLHDRLSSGDMRALLRAADALVSATLGEGFGGPIAEALVEGTPVVAPNHTSLVDILGTDYPLAVASTVHSLKLWNNIDVYSGASPWHVVEDASFVDCLKSLVRMRPADRRALVERTRRAFLARAGAPAVRAMLSRELDACDTFAADPERRMGSKSAASMIPTDEHDR